MFSIPFVYVLRERIGFLFLSLYFFFQQALQNKTKLKLLSMPQKVRADQILYTQDSIGSHFHDGRPLGSQGPNRTIDVYEDSKRRYWALNNRSLYQQKFVQGRRYVNVNIRRDDDAREDAWNRRTRNSHGPRQAWNGRAPRVRD